VHIFHSAVACVFNFQTGPKGVIQDYRRYKQLETEQRREKEKEMKLLAEKFSVSCQSSVSCCFLYKSKDNQYCTPIVND